MDAAFMFVFGRKISHMMMICSYFLNQNYLRLHFNDSAFLSLYTSEI